MKKNVGTYDALIRITVGFFGLAYGTYKMIRNPYRGMPVLVTFFSAMKVAEGMTRFCPLNALLGVSTLRMDDALDHDEQQKPAPTQPME